MQCDGVPASLYLESTGCSMIWLDALCLQQLQCAHGKLQRTLSRLGHRMMTVTAGTVASRRVFAEFLHQFLAHYCMHVQGKHHLKILIKRQIQHERPLMH